MFSLRGNNGKKVALFVIEVLIPFIAVPFLPLFLKDCGDAEAFIIGSSVSIFLAVWTLSGKLEDYHGEMNTHERDTKRGFDHIEYRMNYIETFLSFERELDKVTSPYFKKRINNSLKKNLERFKEENKALFDGHVVTSPYSNDTYGVEGLKWTKSELLAVSSVTDYWERSGFVSEYLKTQFLLISEKSVVIKRIFIGTKDKIQSTLPLMQMQQEGGIDVYFIETDSGFCNQEWCKEDFLIQDRELLVDLKVSSHTAEDGGNEIITVKDIEVNEKIALFNIMLTNATKLTSQ